MRIKYIKKRILALLIDWFLICLYLIILGGITISIYLFFFGRIPEFSMLQSQFVAAITSVIPVCIYSIFFEINSDFGSYGKKKMGLITVHESQRFFSVILRNILKFLPWQLAHMGVIGGIYTDFQSFFALMLLVLSIGLGILYIMQVIITKNHQHLPDLISNTVIKEKE